MIPREPTRDSLARGRRAYVFYATDRTYAIALLVFVHRLRQLGIAPGIAVVALHLPLPNHLIEAMHGLGIETRRVEALPSAGGSWYFRDCRVKLRVFQQFDFDRVIYADVDAIPLRSLDFLFDFPLDAPLAAPLAYWIERNLYTSALWLARPSAGTWSRIERRLFGAGSPYDMNVLNDEFGAEIQSLPEQVFCLDREWESEGGPSLFDVEALAGQVALVHFTSLAKPWTHAPERVRGLRPAAHPFFYGLRRSWWQAREDLLGALPRRSRIAIRAWTRICQLERSKRTVDWLGWG